MKSIVFTVCEHEYMNMCPPIIDLPRPLGFGLLDNDGGFGVAKLGYFGVTTVVVDNNEIRFAVPVK